MREKSAAEKLKADLEEGLGLPDLVGRLYVGDVRIDDTTYYGSGASTDIIEAAVRAYLHALNKHLAIVSA